MAEEKERQSGEVTRNESAAPMLPTVAPAEKTEAPKPAALHPAFYIMYD